MNLKSFGGLTLKIKEFYEERIKGYKAGYNLNNTASYQFTVSEDNGSVRFVEIATQTVTLTNLLTNFNKSLNNCHNITFADNHQNTNVVTNNKSNNSSTNFIDNNNKFHNNPTATATATTSPTINNFNGQVGDTNSTTADAVDNTTEMRL